MPQTDVLEQIKALEPRERARVLDLLLEIEAAQKVDGIEDHRLDDAAGRMIERHADLLRKLAQ